MVSHRARCVRAPISRDNLEHDVDGRVRTTRPPRIAFVRVYYIIRTSVATERGLRGREFDVRTHASRNRISSERIMRRRYRYYPGRTTVCAVYRRRRREERFISK